MNENISYKTEVNSGNIPGTAVPQPTTNEKIVDVESLKQVAHENAIAADRKMFADANARLADPDGRATINIRHIIPGTVVKKSVPIFPTDPKSPLREAYIAILPEMENKMEKDMYRISIELPQNLYRAGDYKTRMDKALSDNDFIEATAAGKALKTTEQNIERFKAQLAAMPENYRQQTAGNIEAMNRFKSELMAIAVEVDGKIKAIEAYSEEFLKQVKSESDKYLNEEKPAKKK